MLHTLKKDGATHGFGSFMVCGCFSSHYMFRLCVIDGTMNGAVYQEIFGMAMLLSTKMMRVEHAGQQSSRDRKGFIQLSFKKEEGVDRIVRHADSAPWQLVNMHLDDQLGWFSVLPLVRSPKYVIMFCRWVTPPGSNGGLQFLHPSHTMFLWAGSKATDGGSDRRYWIVSLVFVSTFTQSMLQLQRGEPESAQKMSEIDLIVIKSILFPNEVRNKSCN